MRIRESQSPKIKALNALFACVSMGSAIFMLVAGGKVVALWARMISLAGLATPVTLVGEGFMDRLIGIFEDLFEGIMVVIEGVSEFYHQSIRIMTPAIMTKVTVQSNE